MLFISRRRRASFVVPYLIIGVGCLALGAGIATLLTPTTGSQLRGRIRNLFRRRPSDQEVNEAMSNMRSEPGIGQGSRYDSHA